MVHIGLHELEMERHQPRENQKVTRGGNDRDVYYMAPRPNVLVRVCGIIAYQFAGSNLDLLRLPAYPGARACSTRYLNMVANVQIRNSRTDMARSFDIAPN
jgi:hypothetical protein